jgi:hypothetical protein
MFDTIYMTFFFIILMKNMSMKLLRNNLLNNIGLKLQMLPKKITRNIFFIIFKNFDNYIAIDHNSLQSAGLRLPPPLAAGGPPEGHLVACRGVKRIMERVEHVS